MTVIYRHKTAGHLIERSRISPKLEASPRWERLTGQPPAPAPAPEPAREPDEQEPASSARCPDCDFVAKNDNGLRLHRQAKHPDTQEV